MHTEKAGRVTITLPPDMLAMIESKIQSGVYESASDVIREAMRLWTKQQEEHEIRIALLRSRLQASLKSGPPVSLDNAFKAIEQVHQQRMQSDRNETV